MSPLSNLLVDPCVWYEIVDQELVIHQHKLIDISRDHQVSLRNYHSLRMTLEAIEITTTTFQAVNTGIMSFLLPKSAYFTVCKK